MTAMLHRLRRIAPAAAVVAMLALAALLRLWALARPDQLVFDEIYYVRDAVSQLAHGFPTTWPDDDPLFGGERARAFSDQAAATAHPPLGKWLIGLGILLLGPDSGWGWRISAALAGVAAVGATMRLGWLMTRSLAVACLAGLILAVDGVHVVLSRVSLLDGFLTLLVVLGALFVWHDQAGGGSLSAPVASLARTAPSAYTAPPAQGASEISDVSDARPAIDPLLPRSPRLPMLGPALWRRPWLLAAGLTFGAAAAVKWSGLYPLAAFLLLVTVRDLICRWRIAERPLLGALRQALIAAAIALPAAVSAYLASWIGRPADPGRSWWASIWEWHAHTLQWHATLTAEHPYASSPLGWPLALRTTRMYWATTAEGAGCPCVAGISTLPNPIVLWGGVAALLILLGIAARAAWRAARARDLAELSPPGLWAAGFVLVGYLSGWLPWVLTPGRTAVFHFYTAVLTPFSALALALVLGALCGATALPGLRPADDARALQGRRIAAAILAVGAVALAILYFPLWSGMPVAEWFARAHLWLPGWK